MRTHAQDIQVTGEALPSAAGECQTAGARVAPAVKTFATHQARPAEVRAQVEVQVALQVEVEVEVEVEVQAEVEAQPEAEAVVQTSVGARRSATRVRGVLLLTKRACRPRPRHWPAPGCERKA